MRFCQATLSEETADTCDSYKPCRLLTKLLRGLPGWQPSVFVLTGVGYVPRALSLLPQSEWGVVAHAGNPMLHL